MTYINSSTKFDQAIRHIYIEKREVTDKITAFLRQEFEERVNYFRILHDEYFSQIIYSHNFFINALDYNGQFILVLKT